MSETNSNLWQEKDGKYRITGTTMVFDYARQSGSNSHVFGSGDNPYANQLCEISQKVDKEEIIRIITFTDPKSRRTVCERTFYADGRVDEKQAIGNSPLRQTKCYTDVSQLPNFEFESENAPESDNVVEAPVEEVEIAEVAETPKPEENKNSALWLEENGKFYVLGTDAAFDSMEEFPDGRVAFGFENEQEQCCVISKSKNGEELVSQISFIDLDKEVLARVIIVHSDGTISDQQTDNENKPIATVEHKNSITLPIFSFATKSIISEEPVVQEEMTELVVVGESKEEPVAEVPQANANLYAFCSETKKDSRQYKVQGYKNIVGTMTEDTKGSLSFLDVDGKNRYAPECVISKTPEGFAQVTVYNNAKSVNIRTYKSNGSVIEVRQTEDGKFKTIGHESTYQLPDYDPADPYFKNQPSAQAEPEAPVVEEPKEEAVTEETSNQNTAPTNTARVIKPVKVSGCSNYFGASEERNGRTGYFLDVEDEYPSCIVDVNPHNNVDKEVTFIDRDTKKPVKIHRYLNGHEANKEFKNKIMVGLQNDNDDVFKLEKAYASADKVKAFDLEAYHKNKNKKPFSLKNVFSNLFSGKKPEDQKPADEQTTSSESPPSSNGSPHQQPPPRSSPPPKPDPQQPKPPTAVVPNMVKLWKDDNAPIWGKTEFSYLNGKSALNVPSRKGNIIQESTLILTEDTAILGDIEDDVTLILQNANVKITGKVGNRVKIIQTETDGLNRPSKLPDSVSIDGIVGDGLKAELIGSFKGKSIGHDCEIISQLGGINLLDVKSSASNNQTSMPASPKKDTLAAKGPIIMRDIGNNTNVYSQDQIRFDTCGTGCDVRALQTIAGNKIGDRTSLHSKHGDVKIVMGGSNNSISALEGDVIATSFANNVTAVTAKTITVTNSGTNATLDGEKLNVTLVECNSKLTASTHANIGKMEAGCDLKANSADIGQCATSPDNLHVNHLNLRK